MENIILREASKADFKVIKKLYIKAFPPEERPPFFIMRTKALQGKGKFLIAESGSTFIGFAYLVTHLDMAYLFYFAIDESKRGMGYGSKTLQLLQEKYKGKRLFLAREQLDENAGNYEERLKRHSFYLHNGFIDLPCRLKEANVIYDLMSNGEMIAPSEYDALISQWSGKFMKKIIDMRIID